MPEYDFSDHLMGCTLDVSIVCSTALEAEHLYKKIYHYGTKYEEIFSRFRATSELSHLNDTKSAVVSKAFFEVFLQAEKLHKITNGIFNPLVQIARHGYDASFPCIKDNPSKENTTPYSTTWDDITYDKSSRMIILTQTQQLDFGGFLKGYVAHKMAEMSISAHGIVVNLGGDIATRGHDENDNIFLFDIYNPYTRSDIQNIPLQDASLATSGVYNRMWHTQTNKKKHHILTPAGTQNPHTDLLSASIIAPNGATADAIATTAIILGSAKAKQFITAHNLSYLLITNNGTIIKNI